MKQYSYPLIILLCITHLNHAFELPHATQAVVGTGVLVLVTGLLSYKMGESSEKNSKEAELNHKRLGREAKESAEQQRQEKLTQRFHHIERMQQTSRTFVDRFRGQAPPERWNDEQQRNFAQEVLATSGSITAFEKQLNTHIKSYETFDPEMAQTHKDLYSIIGYLKRAMHTNPHIATQKKHEEEEAFKQAQKKAYLKKAECEAQAAQNLVTAIAQVKEMALTIKDTTYRNQQQFIDQVRALELTHNRHLTELNNRESRRASEHRETTQELNKLREELGNLQKLSDLPSRITAEHKKVMKELKKQQEAINKLKTDCEEIKGQNIVPSAPPVESLYPPTSNYDPRYTVPTSANPPATNPNYRP